MREPFVALARSIVGQQLSMQAASRRSGCASTLAGPITPERLLSARGGRAARRGPLPAEDRLPARPVGARARRSARPRQAAGAPGRRGHRRADAGQRHRPMVGRDVPRLRARQARRARARRRRAAARGRVAARPRPERDGAGAGGGGREVAPVPQHSRRCTCGRRSARASCVRSSSGASPRSRSPPCVERSKMSADDDRDQAPAATGRSRC